jgi:hypothetical protein
MSPRLNDAIESLYSTFSHYGAADLACCDFPDDLPLNLHLRSTPLERLGPADLQRYAWKAMTTWGTVDNFKHFLPRLLELLARHGEVGHCDPEVLLGKLAYGHWHTWPAGERAAVEDYLHALWRHLRQTYPYALSADAFLCGLGACVDDLGPWLTEWEADATLRSALHLADFVHENVDTVLRRKRLLPHPANAFWSDYPAQARQVWDWLTAPQRLVQLESAFFAHAAADSEGQISAAVDRLTLLRALISFAL